MRLHAYVALYEGETVSSSQLVWASADPELVSLVADRMLSKVDGRHRADGSLDPVIVGRRGMLRRIVREFTRRPFCSLFKSWIGGKNSDECRR